MLLFGYIIVYKKIAISPFFPFKMPGSYVIE